MKRFLLDTNVVSETRKLRPHGAVVAWLDSLVREQVFFPSVVFWELQVGIESTRKQDPAKAQEIEYWVEDMVSTQQILSVDAACFRECARLMQGKSQDLLEDAMIAATARIHGLVVATRNDADFAQLDVPVVNPFRDDG